MRKEAVQVCQTAPFTSGFAYSPLEEDHWQPENLNATSRVFQLKLPLFGRYSFAYQKVQSSTGSMAMLV